jgi:hypothetical protein
MKIQGPGDIESMKEGLSPADGIPQLAIGLVADSVSC